MNAFIRKPLVLAAALCLGGCASTPKPAPQAPPAPEAPKPQAAQPSAAVPAVPLRNPPPMEFIVQANPQNPLISFRLVFHTGSVDDPQGKEGLTALTAQLMAEGGTKSLSSSELLKALFPMAAELDVFPDKEFTTFSGRVHKDFLPRFLDIFTEVILAPRWDPAEFERLKTRSLNAIQNTLRSENDEALGKVALDALLYKGHPYAHYVGGTVQGVKGLTLEDVKAHAARVFTQDRLVVGLAGGVDDALKQEVRKRLGTLPPTGAPRVQLPPVEPVAGQAVIIEKPTLSTGVSMGYVTPLRRGDPDFFPVAFALSYLGEHRQSNGLLFNELREKRGLNYGNYAYVEHFIEEPGTTFTRTNIARTQQDLTLWVRPVVPDNAMFATRGAVYFFNQLAKNGIPEDKFQLTRGFLMGYTRLWEQTDQRRLGFAIDSLFYGTPDFLEQYRQALASMTPESVRDAVRRRLHPEALNFAFVTQDAKGLAELLKKQPPSPIQYASPKSPELLKVDETIIQSPLPVRADAVEVVPASAFMEK